MKFNKIMLKNAKKCSKNEKNVEKYKIKISALKLHAHVTRNKSYTWKVLSIRLTKKRCTLKLDSGSTNKYNYLN